MCGGPLLLRLCTCTTQFSKLWTGSPSSLPHEQPLANAELFSLHFCCCCFVLFVCFGGEFCFSLCVPVVFVFVFNSCIPFTYFFPHIFYILFPLVCFSPLPPLFLKELLCELCFYPCSVVINNHPRKAVAENLGILSQFGFFLFDQFYFLYTYYINIYYIPF